MKSDPHTSAEDAAETTMKCNCADVQLSTFDVRPTDKSIMRRFHWSQARITMRARALNTYTTSRKILTM